MRTLLLNGRIDGAEATDIVVADGMIAEIVPSGIIPPRYFTIIDNVRLTRLPRPLARSAFARSIKFS